MQTGIKSQVKEKFDQTINHLDEDLSSLRTSQASVKLLDRVIVEAYGDRVRLSQVANVTVMDRNSLSVQPWDKANLKTIEKGIVAADLGVSVSPEAGIIRIGIPILTQERRKELVKLASQFGEKAKIAIRNTRRDGIETLKKKEKEGASEDTTKRETAEIEKLVDEYNKTIDKKVEEKSKSIMIV